ncbi:MAG: response regulator [Rhizobacter sp.]|jgi:FixJ family two-component response regulator
MTETRPTVHVVDDDASFLAAASRLLSASGFHVKTFTGAAEFLARADADAEGCVVADLHMPGLSGLDLQQALAGTRNPIPILFLTGHADVASSVRAMRRGAEDFLEKRAPKEALLEAIERAIARDGVARAARRRQRDLQDRFDKLSAREMEVLAHVLRGQLNKQIASDLDISERTVKLHRASIMTKVGVRSVPALTLVAREAAVSALPDCPKGQ